MRRRLFVSAAVCLLPVALLAQADPRPAFDVVSIKPNRTNQGIPLVVFSPAADDRGERHHPPGDSRRLPHEDLQLVDAPDWTVGGVRDRGTDERRDADEHDSPDAALDAGRSL